MTPLVNTQRVNTARGTPGDQDPVYGPAYVPGMSEYDEVETIPNSAVANSTAPTRPVVAGIDGSRQSLVAVDWAAAEAELRQRPLRLVHAFEWPEFNVRLGPPPGAPAEAGFQNMAQAIVDEAQARVRTAYPHLAVTADCVEGFRRPVLVAAAREADLMVVGSRGLGTVGALVIGSTTAELAARAVCPVVIVPEHAPEPTAGDIVVGVDTSPQSRPALQFALDEAHRRGTTVRVVYAWGSGRIPVIRSVRGRGTDHEPTGQDAERCLAEFLAEPLQSYPDVEVTSVVEQGDPRRIVVAQGNDALLVAIGTRGRGTLRGLLLGSVSQSAIHHVRSPIVVVPSRTPQGEDSEAPDDDNPQ